MTLEEYQQTIYNEAVACGLSKQHALIVVAQACHETGNFTSNVFKKDNNCFGMKMPSVRPKIYIDGASSITMLAEGATPYAHFNSIGRSVQDLVLGYLKYVHTDWSTINSPTDYAKWLKSKGFFGDTLAHYSVSLESIYAHLNLKFPVKSLLIPVVASAIVYFLTS